MKKFIPALALSLATLAMANCGPRKGASVGDDSVPESAFLPAVTFDADSAYAYVARQVEAGPRVPNTDAHRKTGLWLASELRRHGAEVSVQNATLTAFDGTPLEISNIFARFNPDQDKRILLLAHWDCRPWADKDPDPAKRTTPVDGANDGASGVGVLLEAARQIGLNNPGKGIDILFVDAEDWGEEENDDSWAMGTRYFIENTPVPDYSPVAAVLLDMVGAPDATFYREYFSQASAPGLCDKFWQAAADSGNGDIFRPGIGGAVTDDHVQLLRAGIPAIDVIDYRIEGGFCPQWHTTSDNMENISSETLGRVGTTLMTFIYSF